MQAGETAAGWDASADGGGSGDDFSRCSDADSDGAVGFAVRLELSDVEVAMVCVAEKAEHFDVAEAVVLEPFVEVVDLAS